MPKPHVESSFDETASLIGAWVTVWVTALLFILIGQLGLIVLKDLFGWE